jgi:hypothetical protein
VIRTVLVALVASLSLVAACGGKKSSTTPAGNDTGGETYGGDAYGNDDGAPPPGDRPDPSGSDPDEY